MSRRVSGPEIAQILPQAAPILMVDEIEIADDGEVLGKKLLSPAWFRGLGLVELPAIYFVEFAMQTLTYVLLANGPFVGKYVIFSGIKRATFFGPAQCGDELTCKVRVDAMLGDRGGVFTFSCAANGAVVAEGTVRFGIVSEEQLFDQPAAAVQDVSSVTTPSALTFDRMESARGPNAAHLLINRLVCAELRHSLSACASVSGDSLTMQGHFKRVKTLNGLYLIQMCEQMVGAATGEPSRVRSIRRFDFKKFNHPGDLLLLEMTRAHAEGPGIFEVQVHSENLLSAIGIVEIL